MGLARDLETNGYALLDATRRGVACVQFVAQQLRARVFGTLQTLGVSHLGVKPKNTYGGNYGLGEIPLHTDLAHWYIPPRYVLLRCVVGDSRVATHLVHYQELARSLPDTILRRALFRPRRPLEGKMYLLRLTSRELIRWDTLFLQPENDEAFQALRLFHLNRPSFKVNDVILDSTGKTVVIDNWRMLHGRSAVPDGSLTRRLERVYLETDPK